ncbi:OsmC family peroxiredoxin [Botryobacter ruber]|uniref:OsmC family peroxiredoxin n=1 Tax=Botryobacter ruber TaxID=2171629 RepID=UPI000E0C03DC|nr:OsmC family peroxiredoxin [Botryobacter ruber]
MKQHSATAKWNKGLKDGIGEVTTGNGTVKSKYSFETRFGEGKDGTSPEELIGAALSGCFSMFLSSVAEKKGLSPEYVKSDAKVYLGQKDGAAHIMKIELFTEAVIPGVEDAAFQEMVKESKANCPASKALAAVPEVTVQATLKK